MSDLSDLSEEAVWCRGEGHQFSWRNDIVTTDSKGVPIEYVREEECAECGVEAARKVDLVRRIVYPRKIKTTTYPDNYLIKGSGRISRSDVVWESIRRLGLVA